MKKIAIFGSAIVLFCLLIWGYFYFNSEPSTTAENAANSTKAVDVLKKMTSLFLLRVNWMPI